MSKKNKAPRGSKHLEWSKEAKYNGICAQCNSKVGVTVDHIIPVHFLIGLGLEKEFIANWEDNFQFLCRPHNVMKSNNIDVTLEKTFRLLEEAIAESKRIYQDGVVSGKKITVTNHHAVVIENPVFVENPEYVNVGKLSKPPDFLY